jgi:hypothetical protein
VQSICVGHNSFLSHSKRFARRAHGDWLSRALSTVIAGDLSSAPRPASMPMRCGTETVPAAPWSTDTGLEVVAAWLFAIHGEGGTA